MEDRSRSMASQISHANRFERPARRRVPIGDQRGTSAQPQLLVLVASLVVWAVIITTAKLIFR
jgi:hypothetical protein